MVGVGVGEVGVWGCVGVGEVWCGVSVVLTAWCCVRGLREEEEEREKRKEKKKRKRGETKKLKGMG